MIGADPIGPLLAAALKLGESRPDRRVPSPSSVSRCTRENWFKARGEEKTDQPDNGESVVAQETGRMSEPFLLQMACVAYDGVPVYEQEDEEGRELSPEELERVSMAGGQVDNILWIAIGEQEVLAEFKRKGIYAYLQLLRGGIREGAEDDYVQVQSLMHAKGLKRCLYVAANFDRSSLTRDTRKWDERPSGVYAEWVEYNEQEALAAKARAEKQTRYIEEEDDPAKVPTDCHGEMMVPGRGFADNNNDFPCSWCRWWTKCKGVG